ncbi:MAG: hypothetical protein QXF12_05265 [Candidatus Aenigmatarchaeota archaeon]
MPRLLMFINPSSPPIEPYVAYDLQVVYPDIDVSIIPGPPKIGGVVRSLYYTTLYHNETDEMKKEKMSRPINIKRRRDLFDYKLINQQTGVLPSDHLSLKNSFYLSGQTDLWLSPDLGTLFEVPNVVNIIPRYLALSGYFGPTFFYIDSNFNYYTRTWYYIALYDTQKEANAQNEYPVEFFIEDWDSHVYYTSSSSDPTHIDLGNFANEIMNNYKFTVRITDNNSNQTIQIRNNGHSEDEYVFYEDEFGHQNALIIKSIFNNTQKIIINVKRWSNVCRIHILKKLPDKIQYSPSNTTQNIYLENTRLFLSNNTYQIHHNNTNLNTVANQYIIDARNFINNNNDVQTIFIMGASFHENPVTNVFGKSYIAEMIVPNQWNWRKEQFYLTIIYDPSTGEVNIRAIENSNRVPLFYLIIDQTFTNINTSEKYTNTTNDIHLFGSRSGYTVEMNNTNYSNPNDLLPFSFNYYNYVKGWLLNILPSNAPVNFRDLYYFYPDVIHMPSYDTNNSSIAESNHKDYIANFINSLPSYNNISNPLLIGAFDVSIPIIQYIIPQKTVIQKIIQYTQNSFTEAVSKLDMVDVLIDNGFTALSKADFDAYSSEIVPHAINMEGEKVPAIAVVNTPINAPANFQHTIPSAQRALVLANYFRWDGLGFPTLIPSQSLYAILITQNFYNLDEFKPIYNKSLIPAGPIDKLYTEAERELLLTKNINSLKIYGGFYVFNNNVTTAYVPISAPASIPRSIFGEENIVRLANAIARNIKIVLKQFVGRVNVDVTRKEVVSKIERMLKENIMIYKYIPTDYRIVCDKSNNVDYSNQMRVDMLVYVPVSAKYINLVTVAMPI